MDIKMIRKFMGNVFPPYKEVQFPKDQVEYPSHQQTKEKRISLEEK